MFWVCETPPDAPFKKLSTVYLILLHVVSIQVCSWHSKLEDLNFLWAQLTPPFAQILLGWVFPARPGLTSIICVLHCEAQWSDCFLGHTAKSAVWDTGLTLPWWYLHGHFAKVTGDEGLGITCGSGLCVSCRAVWGCPGCGPAALAAAQGPVGWWCSASRELPLSWAAAVMGSEQINDVLKKRVHLSYQKQISM